jgi:hypothetical protein
MSVVATWPAWLDSPGACDHLVQLHTDDDFLARAVLRFAGGGLGGGEGAVIVATPPHLALILDRLPDAAPAVARGQLVALDAEETLARLMIDGMPDRATFGAAIGEVLERLHTAGYAKVRFFGEMVNLLWERDALEPAARLEELWNELLRVEDVALLCAYRIDNFDPHAHRYALDWISRLHSHVVPVEDDERLDRVVDRAYADVFGEEGDHRALRDLVVATFGPTAAMPRGLAALLALRGVHPLTADAVLERARVHHAQGA